MQRTIRPDQWQDLAEETADAGTVLLREGDVSTAMLVLVDGEVTVEADGAVLARLSEPGTIVGEMSGLLGMPRTATAVAATDVVYRRADDVVALMQDHPDVGIVVANTLAHRLHLLQSYLVDVRHQYADRTDQLGAVDKVLAALATALPADIDAGSDREYEPNI